MTDLMILLATAGLKCPNCQSSRRLAEYSPIVPILVKCRDCQAVFELSYVRGFWQGVEFSQNNILEEQGGDIRICKQ